MEDFFYRHEGTTVIQATGEDAEDYLQSQWSIDLRKLQIGHVRYGLRLSSKGKILAGAYIARIEEEEFLLISPENSGVQIIKLMEENVVADEVEFLDVSKSWQMHSLFTEGSIGENSVPRMNEFLYGVFIPYSLGGLILGISVAIISYFLLRPLVSTYKKKRDSLKARRLKKKLMRKRNEVR